MKAKYYVDDQSGLFGPGTDLIISLLGVLLMLIAISNLKNKDFENSVKEHQIDLIKAIAHMLGGNYKLISDPNEESDFQKYLISLAGTERSDIVIENSASLQKFTFGGNILFGPDSILLKNNGAHIVSSVGDAIKSKINEIEEIQVHGHADTMPTKLHDSNTILAFRRANSVFNHLTREVGLDPDRELISIVSYGDSNPVKRKGTWNRGLTLESNEHFEQRQENRRIELLINYIWK